MMTKQKSFESLSKEINVHFNWENVHKAMIAIGWNWYLGKDSLGNENYGIPNIATIKNVAFKLLKEAYDEEKQISTGGFTAAWDNGDLVLTFTLEEYSV